MMVVRRMQDSARRRVLLHAYIAVTHLMNISGTHQHEKLGTGTTSEIRVRTRCGSDSWACVET